MFQSIVIKSGGYQAATDGIRLQISLQNGVVVGEGEVDGDQGALWVGEYEGKLDDQIRGAVAELFYVHQLDIAALRLAASGGIAQA